MGIQMSNIFLKNNINDIVNSVNSESIPKWLKIVDNNNLETSTFLDTDNKVQNGGNVDETTSEFLNSGEINQKAGGILSETSNFISSTSDANMTDINNNDVNKLVNMLTTESDSNNYNGET